MADKISLFLGKQALPLTVEGQSMWPFIPHQGRIYLEKANIDRLRINDVVLAKTKYGYVLHRLIFFNSRSAVLQGDNNHQADPEIPLSQIIGRVVKMETPQGLVSLDDHYLTQSSAYLAEITQLQVRLKKEAVPLLFLKGLPLYLYYEKTFPNYHYLDCDLLVPPASVSQVTAVLEENSFQTINRPLIQQSPVERNEITLVKKLHHLPVVFDLHQEAVFLMTELGHWENLYSQAMVEALTNEFWQEKRIVKTKFGSFPILSPENLVLYLALHLFHHNFRGSRRYAFLVRVITVESAKKSFSWKKLRDKITRYQLGNFVYPVFSVLNKTYSQKIPAYLMPKNLPALFPQRGDLWAEQSRLRAGVERFFWLFCLSPLPLWRRLLIIFDARLWQTSGALIKKLIGPAIMRFSALGLLLLTSPLFVLLFFMVKLTSSGPFLFQQKRLGKNKQPFTIFKVRTMVKGAEQLQERLKNKNEADGPVFKIKNDPRFTLVGKIIARLGLDELPQLINIMRGEMDFVGPRPLPLEEAAKVPKKYAARFSVLPGVTSSWISEGYSHKDFSAWMQKDLEYIQKKSWQYDLQIIVRTIIFVLGIK